MLSTSTIYTLAYIGLFFLLKFVCNFLFHVVNGLRIHVFQSDIDLKTTFGEWAVVTGCTEGIGLAYCKELARRGLNLVMISLKEDELIQVSKEIEMNFKVKIHIIQADFSKGGIELYKELKEKLKNINVGILELSPKVARYAYYLVGTTFYRNYAIWLHKEKIKCGITKIIKINNVGVCVPYPMLFEQMSEQILWTQLTVNVNAATMMTSLVLSDMKIKRKGAIINISSVLHNIPLPYFSVYAATKTYLGCLSQALSTECKDSGVTIQTLFPVSVQTNIIRTISLVPKACIIHPSPDTYVRNAISTLGKTDSTTGCVLHEILYWIVKRLPNWILIPPMITMFIYLQNVKLGKKQL